MIFYKATEHLRQSMSSKDPADVEDHARESLRLFKKVPFLLVDETHGRNKLQGICKDYMGLKFFPGTPLQAHCVATLPADVDPTLVLFCDVG